MSQSAVAASVPSQPARDGGGRVIAAATAPRAARRRVSLHVLAACFIATLLVVAVGAIATFTNRGVQALIGTVAVEQTSLIRDALSEKVQGIVEPAETQLALLTYSDLPQAATLAGRLSELPLILDALKRNTLIDASFVGYPNGEFVLFRPLRNDADRNAFKGPPESALLVQSVSRDSEGVMLGVYQFFDADGRLLDSFFRNDYRFDPRTRPWYKNVTDGDAILTDPYPFFTTEEVGATLARRSPDGKAVVGLDITLQSLAGALDGLSITPSAQLAIIDERQHVVGYSDADRMIVANADGGLRLASIEELGVPVLTQAASAFSGREQSAALEIDGRGWQLLRAAIPAHGAKVFTLLIAIPDDELFMAARRIVEHQSIIGVILMLSAVAVGWWGSRRLTRSLKQLVRETKAIRSFDFSGDIKVQTVLTEVDNLAQALDTMKGTIRKFLDIGNALAAERDLGTLLERVLRELVQLAGGDGGVLYLVDKDGRRLTPEIARWYDQPVFDEQRAMSSLSLQGNGVLAEAISALEREEVVVAERQLEEVEIAALGPGAGLDILQAERVGLITVPLFNRKREKLGVMLVVKALQPPHGTWQVSQALRELIRAVSGSAGIAIENRQLLQAQKDLMNGLIKLTAGAIDAKSAYTGGHCQRVPVLTRMLAEAACAQQDGPFKDFHLSEDEWEAVDIASWLHDCGKVTTPEYVVDKATKLETIYDRIHEIRMRFEVLKRDVEIGYWQAVAREGDSEGLRARMARDLRSLDEDFAFVAECNEGGEFMDPARLARLKAIATRTWRRTLDDRLGCSYEEKARKNRSPAPNLPVEEPLLADREDHITHRAPHEILDKENPWGIRVETPPHKLNRGEIYNLAIGRGTLTAEERYIINDHMTQTIMMLESLPLPRHLRNVPEIAGGHHEKMNGKGYPKRLTRDQMSPVARMMAIADVFEALTAADRPYKKAKPLSEAIRIMANMKRDHHLDPELLDLFLTTGIWKKYAERFLDAAQIDEPDIDAVLKTRPA